VSGKRARSDGLFTTRWVHVFEEDTPGTAVYRPEDEDIPLSRRPRGRLELHRDGSASVFEPGPDDRLMPRPASWRKDGGAVVIRAAGSDAELRVIERSPRRLVVTRTHRGK
jgi:hypothetical protein